MFSFKNSFYSILDEIAPLRLEILKKKKSLPWYDNKLVVAERKCSKLFSKWKKSQTDSNKARYIGIRKIYQKLLRQKQISYYENKISKDFKDSKKFWNFHSSFMKTKSK